MKQKLIALFVLAALAVGLFAGCGTQEDRPLSQAQALKIVYAHAGVDEADAEDPHLHVVVEDGQTQYNIHFTADTVSYDYYIDGYTGDIISSEP